MKIALFGGSFNPIHQGHVQLASAVLQELQYQKIIFMPAYHSPFKQEDSQFISPLDRLAMVKLAIEDEKAFESSSYEIEKGESSFTINTIEYLYSLYEKNGKDEIEGKLGLIIGSDQLFQFEKWKDYKKILQVCDLIVAVRRCENNNEDEQMLHKKFDKVGFKFTLLKTPITAISSSNIRTVIKAEKSWKINLTGKILNEKVATYIEENALYGSPFEVAFSDIECLIDKVTAYAKNELSEKRFLHSMRVASMAERLASVYSDSLVPPRLAYLAGVAHDITKEKGDEWQKETVKAENESIDDVENKHLRLLHGRTSAIVLKKCFGIKHRSLLDAIRNHTFAHPFLDSLGKLLYIADKIEEGRQDVEELRAMIGTASINEIMIALLERGKTLLKEKGASPHPFATELLKRLKKS